MHCTNCTAISVVCKTNCGSTKTLHRHKKKEAEERTDRRTEVVQLNADTKRISINVINLPDDLTNCEMKPARMAEGWERMKKGGARKKEDEAQRVVKGVAGITLRMPMEME